MNQRHRRKLNFLSNFPWDQYPVIRPNQEESLEILEKSWEATPAGETLTLIFEEPTGSGKTAIGYTALKTLAKAGKGRCFYITPTKTAVEEVKKQHPEVKIIFGKNEYPCVYYEGISADQAPCSLIDCPHYVDPDTGRTRKAGVQPCLYYLAKEEARKGEIVVATMSFYLLTHLFNQESWQLPAGLVIDEVHKMARMARLSLRYDITDWHLKRAISFLEEIDPDNAQALESFLQKMIKIIRRKKALEPTLLDPWEIHELMTALLKVEPEKMALRIKTAIQEGKISPEEERETLKRLEVLTRDLRRYYHSFEYSLFTPQRKALNYTFAFYKKALTKRERVQYQLSVRAWSVAHLIKKILPSFTVAYSATIGDPKILDWETGVEGSFYTFPSEFPIENTRIFLPTDTPNLAHKVRSRNEPNRILRRIVKSCQQLASSGIRSLVLVVSETERQKFLRFSQEAGLEVQSYGNGLSAKEAVKIFKDGKGEVLMGTLANYGESLDLPKKLAPVIFVLRPDYPKPQDPATIFEERRDPTRFWALRQWRVAIGALQARGRNIRLPEDLGVCIFISQQFKNFLFGSLPEWLKPAYRADLTLEECIEEAMEVVNSNRAK